MKLIFRSFLVLAFLYGNVIALQVIYLSYGIDTSFTIIVKKQVAIESSTPFIDSIRYSNPFGWGFIDSLFPAGYYLYYLPPRDLGEVEFLSNTNPADTLIRIATDAACQGCVISYSFAGNDLPIAKSIYSKPIQHYSIIRSNLIPESGLGDSIPDSMLSKLKSVLENDKSIYDNADKIRSIDLLKSKAEPEYNSNKNGIQFFAIALLDNQEKISIHPSRPGLLHGKKILSFNYYDLQGRKKRAPIKEERKLHEFMMHK